MKKKICMVTTSRLDIDSRIQNEAEALSVDFDVTVLTRKYDLPETLINTPYKVKRVSYVKLWPFKLNIISSFYALCRAAQKENPDYYHAHDLDGLLVSTWVAKTKKKPLIYDSHELWSENLTYDNLKGISWFMPALEKFLVKFTDAGITASQGFAVELKKRYQKDFQVIRNMPKIDNLVKSSINLRELFPGEVILVHAGQTGSARGADKLIQMMSYLPTDFSLVFLGGKKQNSLEKEIERLNLDERVNFVDSVPPNQLINTLKTADLGLVLTENISLSKYLSLPNKLMQYIAAEIPIFASDIPEHRRILTEDKIGELVSGEPVEMAKVIIEMVKSKNLLKYKENLKNLARNKYNWALEGQRLVNFYHRLVEVKR